MLPQSSNHKRVPFKPIGREYSLDMLRKLKQKKILEKNPKRNYILQDEEHQSFLPEQIQVPQQQQDQKLSNFAFSFIQDPRKSSFAHRKFIVMQKILLFVTLFSFMLDVVETEINKHQDQIEANSPLLNIISFITLILVFASVLRNMCACQLYIDQKKIYYRRQRSHNIYWVYLKKMKKKALFLQILLILIHPNALCKSVSFWIEQPLDHMPLPHDLNQILSMVMLIRVYIIFRSLINFTIYSSPRSNRLCTQNGVQRNLLYSIKCILNQQPLTAITFCFLVMLLVLGRGLKLSDGMFIQKGLVTNVTGFQNYNNCLWCVIISMATVGYGDYYPKTILGRVVIFITAIFGVILSSLLIVSLSAYLRMNSSEHKSHVTLARLENQEALQKQAVAALMETIKTCQLLAQNKTTNPQDLKRIFTQFKGKIDLVKTRQKKLKSLVDNDSIIEEMNRLFELLNESLRQVYTYQKQLRSILLEMKDSKVTNGNKISFKREFDQFLTNMK